VHSRRPSPANREAAAKAKNDPAANFHRLVIERFRRIGSLPTRNWDWETEFFLTHVFGRGKRA